MNRITERIWIGDSHDARNITALKEHDIRYLLNCAEDLPSRLHWEHGIRSFHCGLCDGENHPSLYLAAIHILESIHDGDNRVLVHCHEGRSRSVYVVACYLVKSTMHDIHYWIDKIKERGRDVKVNEGHFKSYLP